VGVGGKEEGGGVATRVIVFLKLGFDKGEGPGGGGCGVDSCSLTLCILIMHPFSLFVFGVYSSCSLRDGVVANVLFLM